MFDVQRSMFGVQFPFLVSAFSFVFIRERAAAEHSGRPFARRASVARTLDFGGSREARPYRRGALGRSCPPRPSACRTGAVPRFNGKT
jgi:hypothetical protein